MDNPIPETSCEFIDCNDEGCEVCSQRSCNEKRLELYEHAIERMNYFPYLETLVGEFMMIEGLTKRTIKIDGEWIDLLDVEADYVIRIMFEEEED